MNSTPQNPDIQSILPLSAAVFAILLSLAPERNTATPS